MEWPWQRFEGMFRSHMRRKAVRSLEEIKLAQLAGSWGNPNFDDGKNARQQFLKSVEDGYWAGVAQVYGVADAPGADLDQDPFYAKVKLPDVPGEIDTGALRDRQAEYAEADVDQE